MLKFIMHFDPWLKYQFIHPVLQNVNPDLNSIMFWSRIKNTNLMLVLSFFDF